jgi:hypothetical protein
MGASRHPRALARDQDRESPAAALPLRPRADRRWASDVLWHRVERDPNRYLLAVAWSLCLDGSPPRRGAPRYDTLRGAVDERASGRTPGADRAVAGSRSPDRARPPSRPGPRGFAPPRRGHRVSPRRPSARSVGAPAAVRDAGTTPRPPSPRSAIDVGGGIRGLLARGACRHRSAHGDHRVAPALRGSAQIPRGRSPWPGMEGACCCRWRSISRGAAITAERRSPTSTSSACLAPVPELGPRYVPT